jgi:phosphoglycerate dehydrogenase-like enzyme
MLVGLDQPFLENIAMLKMIIMPPQSQQTRQWAEHLRDALPDYQVVAPETEADAQREIADSDAAYGWVPPALLPLATRLRWLQSAHAGPPTGYYYPELVEHPLVVCNPRGVFNDHIGQHIMMFVLALARGLPCYLDAQRERRWDTEARKRPAIDLASATALLVGVGGIGHEAARLCATFGMRVLGIDTRWEYATPHVERHASADLDRLLPAADFVIVSTPHTPETEGMWNARLFGLMKPTGYFINVGRGMTTRLDDLAAAIAAGQIAGCALDVYETEPLPADHALWRLPDVILTPHIAVKDAANIDERRFALLLDNARRFATGQSLRNVVDKTAWY